MEHKIVFATHNENKLKEVAALLSPLYHVVGLNDIGCHEDIPETENTLEGNAYLKSKYVYDHYGLDCFSDDTGLEVTALHGEPGVFSARYAGEGRNSDDNMAKLLRELHDKTDRSAQFRTVISLILKGEEHHVEGSVRGNLIEEKRGRAGFGYDPIFQPIGYAETFAELGSDVKNEISHRAIAVKKLIRFLHDHKA